MLGLLFEQAIDPIWLNLCNDCTRDLNPDYTQKCLSCGAGHLIPAVEPGATESLTWVEQCVHCRRSRLLFRRCVALGNYERGLREAVLKVKAGTHDALIHDMARLLASQVTAEADLEGVIPIPTHWKRRMLRRTVVAELLAERVARQLGLPFHRRSLRCRKVTKKQGTLSTNDRIRNVKNSFRLGNPACVRDKRILLVDDVMTSGATLNEATSMLLSAGAKSVTVAVIARGVGRSMNR